MMKDYSTELVFQEHLLRDERILWNGQPDPNKLFTPLDIFLVPFSLLWGGFAIFWELSALIMIPHDTLAGLDIIFPLFGLPFVIIGLYFIFGRFIYKKWKKRRTYYAVTNKRIVILEKTFAMHLREIDIKSISEITRRVGSNDTGALIFGVNRWSFFMGFGFYANTGLEIFPVNQQMAFWDIKDATKVYGLIKDLKDRQE